MANPAKDLTPEELALVKRLPTTVIGAGHKVVAAEVVRKGYAKWDPEYEGWLEATEKGDIT